jgi:hypothetical protein
MFDWFRKQKPKDTRTPLPPLPEVVPTFDLNTVFHKLYEADGKGESVTLDPSEVTELFDYLEYATYLDSMVRYKKIRS